MVDYLLNKIECIDFMSSPPELLINKKSTLTSVYGGLLSSIYLMFLTFCAYFFGGEMFKKSVPNLHYEESYLKEDYLFNLSNEDFYVKINTAGKNDKSSYYYKYDILNVNQTLHNDIKNNSKIYYDLNFIDSLKNEFLNTDAVLRIEVFSDEFNDNNLAVKARIADNIINMSSFKSPISKSDYTNYFYLDRHYTIVLNFRINIFDISSDSGYFIYTFQDLSSYQILPTSQSFILNSNNKNKGDSNDNPLLIMNFFLNNKKTTYIRNYVKFHEVVSNLGGLNEVLSFISFLLYYFYHSINTKLYLVNKYFDLPANDKVNSADNTNKKQITSIFSSSKKVSNKKVMKFVNNKDEDQQNKIYSPTSYKSLQNGNIIYNVVNKTQRYEHQKFESSSKRFLFNRFKSIISLSPEKINVKVQNEEINKLDYRNKSKDDSILDLTNKRLQNLNNNNTLNKIKFESIDKNLNLEKIDSITKFQSSYNLNTVIHNCKSEESPNQISPIKVPLNIINSHKQSQSKDDKSFSFNVNEQGIKTPKEFMTPNKYQYSIKKDDKVSVSDNQSNNSNIDEHFNKKDYYSLNQMENINHESNIQQDKVPNYQSNDIIDFNTNLKINNLNNLSESLYSINYDKISSEMILSKEINKPVKREKLKLNLFEKFLFCFHSENKNINKLMLNKGFNLIKGVLSIENIIDLTRNVAKLRYFLLTNYENAMIDYMGNPIIENVVRPDNHYDNLDIFIKSFTDEVGDDKIEFPLSNKQLVNISKNNFSLLKISEAYNKRP